MDTNASVFHHTLETSVRFVSNNDLSIFNQNASLKEINVVVLMRNSFCRQKATTTDYRNYSPFVNQLEAFSFGWYPFPSKRLTREKSGTITRGGCLVCVT